MTHRLKHTVIAFILTPCFVFLGNLMELNPVHVQVKKIVAKSAQWLDREYHAPSESELRTQVVCLDDLGTQKSNLKGTNGEVVSVLNREKLLMLVSKIAKNGNNVIALDVDFSLECPDNQGRIQDDCKASGARLVPSMRSDPELLSTFAALSPPTEVVVGVWRQASSPQEWWFIPGASGRLPNAGVMSQFSETVMEVPLIHQHDSVANPTFVEKVRRLAKPKQSDEHLVGWLAGLFEDRFDDTVTSSVVTKSAFVTFGSLKTLLKTKVNADDVLGNNVTLDSDKVVFAGPCTKMAKDASDVRGSPDFHENIPGVFIHAAATHSLLDSPVYVPKESASNWFDVLLGWSLILLESLIIANLSRVLPSNQVEHTTIRILKVWRLVLFAFFVTLAILATLKYKIIWTEVMFLFLGFVVSDPIEVAYEWLMHKFKSRKQPL
jgi:CHASE2 domain-containing sensor protein